MSTAYQECRSAAPANKILLLILSTVIVLGSVGCAAIGKPIGRGALAGAQRYVRTEPGRDSVRAMIDTLLAHAGRSSQPVLDTATTRLLVKAQLALDTATARLSAAEERVLVRTRDSLTAVLRGEWSDALAKLARAGVQGAGQQGTIELARIVLGLRTEMDRQLITHLDNAVAAAAGNAIDSISSRFAVRLSTDLRAGLVLVADTVARVGARAAVESAGSTAPKTSAWKRATKIAIYAIGGVILAALILAAAWLYNERRRNREMLAVVTEEIHRSGDSKLKSRIKTRATQRQIEGALRDFLVEKKLVDPVPDTSATRSSGRDT
jgi:hypothetical protein